MVWVYVVIGLLIILVLVVLLKGERRHLHGKKYYAVNTLTICLSCGSRFRGSKCPYCGFEHAEYKL
ncbi:hypothetical protein HRbin04_01036 [archaeon HR04]|nr:hypothetical protein HRbin04_01036 [archaeon HR04]